MKTTSDIAETFMRAKPVLMGIAYRMLGTRRDAEDIVQEVYVKLLESDYDAINNAQSWMTTVCTRLCLDFLKSAEQKRVDYIGPWLPEPLSEEYSSDNYLEISNSLSTAFLLMLERLTPKERAVFLLREILDQDYSDVATALNMSNEGCRKIYSRAKSHIRYDKARHNVAPEYFEKIYDSFKLAVTEGDLASLEQLLADDIQLSADGGGKVAALNRQLVGAKDVVDFVSKGLREFWKGMDWRQAMVNGQLGVIISSGEHIHAVATFGCDSDGRLSHILIMRNPDKLTSFRYRGQ